MRTDVTGAVPQAVDRENPWPGLAAFEEGDVDFFKGRDEPVSAIARLIVREDLAFLWGFSGLGKTSLLRAGLLPRLRQVDIFPVYVRLHYDLAARSLRDQCFDAIEQAASRWGYELPERAGCDTIWEYVRRREQRFWSPSGRLATPLLVFDQFEELFAFDRSGRASEEVRSFFADVSNAISGSAPEWHAADGADEACRRYLFRPGIFKVLLSFREDFVAQVAKCAPLVTSIGHNFYRLESLSFDDAVTVVEGAGGHLIENAGASAHRTLCEQVVSRVAGAASVAARSTATVDPALLSLFCSQLNQKRKDKHKATIDASLLESEGASLIIPEFYESCMRAIGEPARAVIEQRLVLQQSRTRDSLAEEMLIQEGVSRQELGFLIDKRILRRDSTKRQPRIEFTHDVLVEPALAALARREAHRLRAEEERRRIEQEHERSERLSREVQAERQRADSERRKKLLVGLVAATAIAALATWRAFHLSQEQTIRLLLQASRSQLAQDPQLSAIFSGWAARAVDRHAPEIEALAKIALTRSMRAAALSSARFDIAGSEVVMNASGSRAAVIQEYGSGVRILDLSQPTAAPLEVAAAPGKQILAAQFFGADDSLVVINSDSSVERIFITDASVRRTAFSNDLSPIEADRLGIRSLEDERQAKQWVFSESGQLLVVSFTREYPKVVPAAQGTGAATAPMRYRLSVADIGSGRWLPDVPLLSATGDVVVAANGSRFAVVDEQQHVVIRTLSGATIGERTFGHSVISLSPDGMYVVAMPRAAPGAADTNRVVTVWEVGQPKPSTLSLPGRDEVVDSAFSPDGRVLAVVQAPGIAQLWDLRTLRPVFASPIDAIALRFSPDGRKLVTWDRANERRFWNLQDATAGVPMPGGREGIVDVHIAATGDRVAILTRSGLQVWSPAAQNPVDTAIDTGRHDLNVIAYSPDGSQLTVAGGLGGITIDLASQRLHSLDIDGEVTALAYSPDGRRLAVAMSYTDTNTGVPNGRIQVLALETPRRIAAIDTGPGRITAVAFAGAGGRLVYARQTGDIAGRIEMTSGSSTGVTLRGCVPGRVRGLAADAASRRYAFLKLNVEYANTATASPIAMEIAPFDSAANRGAVTECGNEESVPAAASPQNSGPKPKPLETMATAGAISGDLSFAVSSTVPTELTLWPPSTITQAAIAFGDQIGAVAVAADGKQFAAGGDRGLIKVYSTDLVLEPVVLQSTGTRVRSLAFDPHGESLAALTADGAVTIYPLGLRELIRRSAVMCHHRRPTAAECAFLGGGCDSDPTSLSALVRRMVPLLRSR